MRARSYCGAAPPPHEDRGHEESGRKDERQLHRRDDACQRTHVSFITQS
jgi:hypothetical protein